MLGFFGSRPKIVMLTPFLANFLTSLLPTKPEAPVIAIVESAISDPS